MEPKLFHNKKTYKKDLTFLHFKNLFVIFIGIAMLFFPTASFSTVNTTNVPPQNSIEEPLNQEITQIADQITTANPGIDANTVTQTLQQLASQSADQGAGGDVNQIITQIASQVAANPTGAVAQNILQQAQQEAVSLEGPTNQQITQIAEQLASSTGADQSCNIPITHSISLTECRIRWRYKPNYISNC